MLSPALNHFTHHEAKPARPREPLLNTFEIADKLRIPHKTLLGLVAKHRDGAPETRLITKNKPTSGQGRLHLYHLSDFRRWVLTNCIDLSNYNKAI